MYTSTCRQATARLPVAASQSKIKSQGFANYAATKNVINVTTLQPTSVRTVLLIFSMNYHLVAAVSVCLDI